MKETIDKFYELIRTDNIFLGDFYNIDVAIANVRFQGQYNQSKVVRYTKKGFVFSVDGYGYLNAIQIIDGISVKIVMT